MTVLDYGASFHSLSSEDVDQILLNSRMEECAISIDSSLKRVQETIVSAAKTRCQRDLGERGGILCGWGDTVWAGGYCGGGGVGVRGILCGWGYCGTGA